MSEPVIKKNEERKPVKLEAKTLTICPDCSVYYGTFQVVSDCDCGCGEYLDGEVMCSEGRHYFKACFEQMEKDGLVEKEAVENG